MSAPPLSHHEIVELVGPYARQGLRVDLAASDRLGRRLLFQRTELPADAPALAGLRETLQLESFGTGTCRLTRTLSIDRGPSATLQVLGPDPGRLLEQVRALAPQRQFRRGDGYVTALSYELYPLTGAVATGAAPGANAVLTRGVVRLDAGHTLTLTLSAVRGVAASLALEPATGKTLALPEDLLAVLGWDWARLIVTRDGWTSRLRLRGDALRRTARAELELQRAAAHLVRTLAEPPVQFHARWCRARWGVFARRGLPVLTLLGILVAAAVLPRMAIQDEPALVMLIFHVPVLLIALSFSLQELPQFEIPPLPRPHPAAQWQRAAAP